MERKKTLVVLSLFILMTTVMAQFPVMPTTSGTAQAGDKLNLHAVDTSGEGVLIDLYNPENTIWHELAPVFCGGPFLIWRWRDLSGDGKLSPCDKVDLMDVSNPDNPVFVGFFHVTNVTVTLLVYNTTQGYPFHPAFIEFKGDIQEFPWGDPVCTEWLEKYPSYGLQYHLTSWAGAGVLSVGDMVDMDFGAGVEWYYVAQIATDIWVEAMPAKDYITMGGKMEGSMYVYVQNYANNCRIPYGGVALPMAGPFVTRPPYLNPMCLLEEILFLPPVDVCGNGGLGTAPDGVPDIIPIEKVQVNPIVHYVYIPPPLRIPGTFWRFTLVAPAPGKGVIFINPNLPGDVDCYTVNKDDGVFWTGPSPLAGQFAAASGGHINFVTGALVPGMGARFPSGGVDSIPGTGLWGDPLDGFGDKQADPVGSSILMLPLMLMGDEWNATLHAWVPTMVIPMPLILTTRVAYDHVAAVDPTPWNCPGECFLYCTNSTVVGKAWDFPGLTKVTYVCAWSNLRYSLNPDDDNDGIPEPDAKGMFYTLDAFYEYVEKKVWKEVVIADINCDNLVDIFDLVMCGVAYCSRDEGFDTNGDGLPDLKVADKHYDARADLDGNGHVDIFDLVKVALDFGKRLP